MVMLLNGQYEELIDYAKEEMASSGQSQQLESLIDLLVYKIEEK